MSIHQAGEMCIWDPATTGIGKTQTICGLRSMAECPSVLRSAIQALMHNLGGTMNTAGRCVYQINKTLCSVILIVLVSSFGLPVGAQQQSGKEKIRLVYELYSWMDTKTGCWNFCILYNTSRQKTVAEVFNKKAVLIGLVQIKRKISSMPKGSHVIWFDRLTVGSVKVEGSQRLNYPPSEIVGEIKRFARTRHIEVLGPPTPATP